MAAIIVRVREGNPRDHIDELISILQELFEVAVEYMYTNSMKCLKVGAVGRKMIGVGYKTVWKAVQAALHGLVPHLSNKQILIAAEYYEGLIVPTPEQSKSA